MALISMDLTTPMPLICCNSCKERCSKSDRRLICFNICCERAETGSCLVPVRNKMANNYWLLNCSAPKCCGLSRGNWEADAASILYIKKSLHLIIRKRRNLCFNLCCLLNARYGANNVCKGHYNDLYNLFSKACHVHKNARKFAKRYWRFAKRTLY